MLSFVRIIKNELHKQDKLPDKYNDYNYGYVYDKSGNTVEIGKNENLNTIRSSNLYFCQSGLSSKDKTWEFRYKIKVSYNSNGAHTDYQKTLISIDGSTTAGRSSSALGLHPSTERPTNGCSVFAGVGLSFGTRSPRYIDVVYWGDGKGYAYAKVVDLDTGESDEGKFQIGGTSMTGSCANFNVRPTIACGNYTNAHNGVYRSCVKELYLKDITFIYDGKTIFKRA